MRLFLAALIAAPALAQQAPPIVDGKPEVPPSAPVAVGRVTMAPGDVKAFRITPGAHHVLLVPTTPDSQGAMTLRYSADGGQSTLAAVNRTGRPLRFTILSDPNNSGGFQPAGAMMAPGDGTAATRSWPTMLGTINVGGFRPG